MNKIELARKALEKITDESFPCTVGCTEGGKCGAGYTDDYQTLDLSREQILSLISCPNEDEVLKDIVIDPVDVDSMLTEMAYESSWPDGGPAAYVQDVVPVEFDELEAAINDLEADDAEGLEEIRKKLAEITDGDYNILFDIKGDYDYYFAENEEFEFHLTGDEVRGLLNYACDRPEVFEGICDAELDEDFLNEKAQQEGIADGCDYFSYGGSSDKLDNYINSWDTLLDMIFSGEVNEENLDEWLEYFDDDDNWELEIEDWKD